MEKLVEWLAEHPDFWCKNHKSGADEFWSQVLKNYPRITDNFAELLKANLAVPGSSAPGSSAPGTDAPCSSAPGSSAPGSTAPGTTAAGAQPAAPPKRLTASERLRISREKKEETKRRRNNRSQQRYCK